MTNLNEIEVEGEGEIEIDCNEYTVTSGVYCKMIISAPTPEIAARMYLDFIPEMDSPLFRVAEITCECGTDTDSGTFIIQWNETTQRWGPKGIGG